MSTVEEIVLMHLVGVASIAPYALLAEIDRRRVPRDAKPLLLDVPFRLRKILVAVSLIGMSVQAFAYSLPEGSIAGYTVVLVAVCGFVSPFFGHFVIYSYWAIDKVGSISRQVDKVEKLEEELGIGSESVVDTAIKNLTYIIERDRLDMLRARESASTLSFLATVFFVLSVAAPILSCYIYWRLDPLPETAIERLTELSVIGYDIASTPLPFQRDWRILLCGTTFAFLVLGAGAALMRQVRSKLEHAEALRRHSAPYSNLSGALRIAEVDTEEEKNRAVRRITERLLETPFTSGHEVRSKPEEAPDVSEELLKRAAIKGVEEFIKKQGGGP